MNGLEQEYGDQIEFQIYNIAEPEDEAWANTYTLIGHPAYILLDAQGHECWRAIGVIPTEQKTAEFSKVLEH